MEPSRVMEVYCEAGRKAGTGYLTTSGTVLTAWHVAQAAGPDGLVEVRPLTLDRPAGRWFAARVAWPVPEGLPCAVDVALLALTDPAWQDPNIAPVRWGQITGHGRIPVLGLGFPDAAKDRRPGSAVRDTLPLRGHVDPLAHAKSGKDHVVVGLDGPLVPASGRQGSSPWSGASGTALFVPGTDILLAVTTDDHELAADARVLTATPVSGLAVAPGFASVAAAHGIAVETVDVSEENLDVAALGPGPGMPIGQCDPIDLEVHPATDGFGRDAAVVLPGYVRRAHDEALNRVVAKAASGRSAMAVLVGSSSTGKTRACWEAVQPLAEDGWRLWHPFDPTRADAALAGINAVGPRTVVWLNEAQHYLNAGEQIASALHALLTDPTRGPVLVLGTLWPEYDQAYAALPQPGQPDRYAGARKLLARRRIAVPGYFDQDALRQATILAEDGDLLLAMALKGGLGGRVAQHLAGAPELWRRYENASPAAKGLLDAAMDARRLGVGPHLPREFLVGAVTDYLHPEEWDALREGWLEQALAELAEQVHGSLAPLRKVRPRPHHDPPATGTAAARVTDTASGPLYRLADYLEQQGRRERWALCPPASFWHAAHAHLANFDDLHHLGRAAERRHRLQWAAALYLKAVDAGETSALGSLAAMWESVGDQHGAEKFWLRAADAGDAYALTRLATMSEKARDWRSAETFYQRAADAGDVSAPTSLAAMLYRAGHPQRSEAVLKRAADAGNIPALIHLAEGQEQAENWRGAEMFYWRAADAGGTYALAEVAWILEKAGNREEAEKLYRRAAEASALSLFIVTRIPLETHWQRANELYELAADAGDIWALWEVAGMRESAGDQQEAMRLIQRAADAGDSRALMELAHMNETAGDWHEAETVYLRAVDAGERHLLTMLVEKQERALGGLDYESALQHVLDADEWNISMSLAEMLDRTGDRRRADALARRSADAGDTQPLIAITHARIRDGDPGAASVLRYGLNPDGTPTQPW